MNAAHDARSTTKADTLLLRPNTNTQTPPPRLQLLDKADESSDRKLAKHLVALFGDPSARSATEAPVPAQLLREYIAYARSACQPVLTDAAAEALAAAYAGMRVMGISRKVLSRGMGIGRWEVMFAGTFPSLPREQEGAVRVACPSRMHANKVACPCFVPSPLADFPVSCTAAARCHGQIVSATPRQLESLIRLSEAQARMRLRGEVLVSDVHEAVRLMKVTRQAARRVRDLCGGVGFGPPRGEQGGQGARNEAQPDRGGVATEPFVQECRHRLRAEAPTMAIPKQPPPNNNNHAAPSQVAMQQSSIDPRTGQIDMDIIQTGARGWGFGEVACWVCRIGTDRLGPPGSARCTTSPRRHMQTPARRIGCGPHAQGAAGARAADAAGGKGTIWPEEQTGTDMPVCRRLTAASGIVGQQMSRITPGSMAVRCGCHVLALHSLVATPSLLPCLSPRQASREGMRLADLLDSINAQSSVHVSERDLRQALCQLEDGWKLTAGIVSARA